MLTLKIFLNLYKKFEPLTSHVTNGFVFTSLQEFVYDNSSRDWWFQHAGQHDICICLRSYSLWTLLTYFEFSSFKLKVSMYACLYGTLYEHRCKYRAFQRVEINYHWWKQHNSISASLKSNFRLFWAIKCEWNDALKNFRNFQLWIWKLSYLGLSLYESKRLMSPRIVWD